MIEHFDNRSGFIWLDGKIVAWNDAKVHVLNHGLHYASSVFEGIAVYNGKPFMLSEHIERLFYSAKELDMQITYSQKELESAVYDVLQQQEIKDVGYIRPFAWRGSEQLTIAAKDNSIHVAIAAWERPQHYYNKNQAGLRLTLGRYKRPSPETAPTGSKSAGLYMISTICKHEAQRAGYDEVLLLDYRDYIAETASSNIFFVQDGSLVTPIADCFLNGITRQLVIKLARENGIGVEQTRIKLDDLTYFDDCFLTGTASELTSVGLIQSSKLGESWNFIESDIQKTLKKAYRDLVRKQTR